MRSLKSLKVVFISSLFVGLPALAAASGGGGHEEDQMWPIIFSAINLILFVTILVVVLRKPLANFLRERSKDIATDIEESSRLLEEAEKRHEEMKSRIDRLDAEVADLKEQLRQEGEAQGERIIERSKQLIERVREDAKFQAEQQVKMARKALQAEAGRLAVEAAEVMLRKSVNDQDHDRLVGRFLKEVKEP